MSERTINIAPTAEAMLALCDRMPNPDPVTLLCAKTAVDGGYGDVTIDRLSLRLCIDGETVTRKETS